MKPKCFNCNKVIPGSIKIKSCRKKAGKQSKNVVEYYCENCFKLVEKEKAWNVHREKEKLNKIQNIKRQQRKQRKVR